jgi:hypothetical protein
MSDEQSIRDALIALQNVARIIANAASDWNHNDCGDDDHYLGHSNRGAYIDDARAAFAVFEKAHAPTDDERETLIDQATWALIEYDTDVSDRGVRDEHYRDRRADVERVFPILFRRSEVPVEQVEHCCAHPKCPGGSLCCCQQEPEPQGEPSGAQVERAAEEVKL